MCDLKRFVHDELVQLITDKRPLNVETSSSSKLNSLIRKIQSKSEEQEGAAKNKINQKIEAKNQKTIIYRSEPEKTTKNYKSSLASILKNSDETKTNSVRFNLIKTFITNEPKKCLEQNIDYVDSAYNQQNKQLIPNIKQQPVKMIKTLSSPSLTKEDTIQLTVKEKVQLFTNNNLNKLPIEVKPIKNEKTRPLSQILKESIKTKNLNNSYLFNKNDLSLSTIKLEHSLEHLENSQDYNNVHSFGRNNFLNNKLNKTESLDTLLKDEELKSVKDKIAYFTSKQTHHSSVNDLKKKISLNNNYFKKRN